MCGKGNSSSCARSGGSPFTALGLDEAALFPLVSAQHSLLCFSVFFRAHHGVSPFFDFVVVALGSRRPIGTIGNGTIWKDAGSGKQGGASRMKKFANGALVMVLVAIDASLIEK